MALQKFNFSTSSSSTKKGSLHTSHGLLWGTCDNTGDSAVWTQSLRSAWPLPSISFTAISTGVSCWAQPWTGLLSSSWLRWLIAKEQFFLVFRVLDCPKRKLYILPTEMLSWDYSNGVVLIKSKYKNQQMTLGLPPHQREGCFPLCCLLTFVKRTLVNSLRNLTPGESLSWHMNQLYP